MDHFPDVIANSLPDSVNQDMFSSKRTKAVTLTNNVLNMHMKDKMVSDIKYSNELSLLHLTVKTILFLKSNFLLS